MFFSRFSQKQIRKTKKSPARKLGLESLEDRSLPSTVSWTGGSGNWDTAANWSGDKVPGTGDDIVISTSSAATITIRSGDSESVHSLNTAGNDTLSITGGSLEVAANSTLAGPLAMTGGSLEAKGAGATLTATGTTTATAVSLDAEGGATLSLPGLTSFVANGSYFTANGTGSVLDLSNLTHATQTGGWQLQASNGGAIKLTGLTSLTSTSGISIYDTGHSTLLDDLTSLTGISVHLDGSDAQVANTWAQFLNGNLTVTGGSYSLPGLTNVNGSSLDVEGGGGLALPKLTSFVANGSYFTANGTNTATGAASVLDLSNLTHMTQSGGWQIEASNGGEIKLTGLASLTSTNGITIYDTNGSTLLNALTSLTGINVHLDGTDAQVANTWTQFLNGNFTVTGGSYALPGLTNVNGSSLDVEGGGGLALPKLTSFVANGSYFTANGTNTATGAASVLDLSNLTHMTQSGGWQIEASNGGEIKLTGLASLTSTNGITIYDTNGSTLLNDLTSLTGINVHLDGSDAQVANTWTQFLNGNLTVTGGLYALPGLTNVNGSSLDVEGGGGLALPKLTSFVANGSYFTANGTNTATGAASVLDLSNLTHMTQSGGWQIEASNGGEIKLTGLASLTSTNGITIYDTNGSTLLNALTSLTGINVHLDGTDAQVANTWTQFLNGNLTVTEGSYALPGLTNVNGSSLDVEDGGGLALPQLTSFIANGSYFTANGTNTATGAASVLDLSNLTNVTQMGGWQIEANNGGEIKLTGLTSLTSTKGISIYDTNGSTLLADNLTTLKGATLNLTGSTLTLGKLSNTTGSDMNINSDGVFAVPAGIIGGTYTIAPTGTLILGADNVTPTSLSVPRVFAADGWVGTFSGTANDVSGTGLASVGVSFSNGSKYFDGTAFESTTPVYLPANLSGTNWTLTIPMIDFPSDVACTVSTQALDKAGGVESSTITSLVLTQSSPIDTVAPTVSMTAPANGSSTSNTKPTLTATAADNTGGSGLASVQFQYSSNGGTSWTNAGAAETNGPFSFTFTTALANGTYAARAIATDNAGNSATSSAVSFTVGIIAPTISMTAPANGSDTNNNKPTLSATASEPTGGNGLASVQFQYSSNGGTSWTNAGAEETSGPFGLTFTTALADGSYEARAIATDNASNSTTSSVVSFTIDTVAPTITMTAPANGSDTNVNKPTLTATASDNNGGTGLASVQFQYSSNGGTTWTNAGAAEMSGPFGFAFTGALADGSYEARAIATDNAGNNTTSSIVSFAIDTVAPIVAMTAPVNGSNSGNTKPTLSATASDNNGGTGLASVQFQYSSNGGTSWSNAGAAETSGPFSFTFTTALATGMYEARAIATDNAGNSTTSSTVSFGISVVQASPTLGNTPGGTVVLGSGSKLTDSATLAKGSNPSGTITFTCYAPDGKTIVDTETATVNGNGTYTTSTGYLPTAVGTYQWVASYSGDGANKAVASTKTAEKVSLANLTISTISNSPVFLGSGILVTDSATLSGGYNPTGTIIFVLFAPNGRAVDTESVTVNGDGNYNTPTGYMPSTAGTYQWVASYSGDGNNKAVSTSLKSDPVTVIGAGATVIGKTLYLVGGSGDDHVQIVAVGSSVTGSTGVKINADLNGASVASTYSQSFTTIYVYGFGGNDSIQEASKLTVPTVVNEGDGDDSVQLGNGNNSVTLGNGDDSVMVGNGNNVVVTGNGTDSILAGNGNNLIAAGLGQHTVVAGTGSNILIDGTVTLTKSGDSLTAVLSDWTQIGGVSTNVASIRSRLTVTDNSGNANMMVAGSGLDWFWETFGQDMTNRKATDLLN